jgi:putative sterol carrier protein
VTQKYAFLSDEWIAGVEALVAANAANAGTAPHANVLVNLVVTGTPFGERLFHMGSAEGSAVMGGGHRDGADVTLTTDYVTAKEVFVSGNPQAGMQAFMSGKVKVQGDMTKLMMSQAAGGGAGGADMTSAIQAMTE